MMKRRITAVDRLATRYLNRFTIHDPEYNIREAAKQMVLLEDHLFQPHKLCPDCVRKHLLAIEALGEEMVSLVNPTKPNHVLLQKVGPLLSNLARKWVEDFNDGKQPDEIGTKVRETRKRMVKCVPDPRQSV